MRRLLVLALLVVAACGDNLKANGPADAHAHGDSGNPDASHDAMLDAFQQVNGIAEVRAATDGTGLSLPIKHVTVTYLKPQIGSTVNDPAGFTIQEFQDGPALFVSVDPTTLTPVPVVGDVVDFTVTAKATVGMEPRATALSGFTRTAQGANLAAIAQDVSAKTDLVSAIDSYDSELVSVTGTLDSAPSSSGTGFQKFTLTTAGISGNVNLQLRAPVTLVGSIDMAMGCGIAATNIPFGRFNAAAELGVFVQGDFVMTGCPAPTVVSAVALSSTSVRVTFSRNLETASVMADASQFTFDNGLTASGVTVSGNLATLTTSAQGLGTSYTVTVANTVTDLQGTALGTPATATFLGFVSPASVRINELNANILNGCDLIELRVLTDGSMGGFKITERNGGSGELTFTFPAGFLVHKNDFIVIHENSADTTNCNPGTGTQEVLTKTDQPHATFGANYDTAFDFYAVDTGLTSTDNVITLFDATNTIIDALFVSDDPAALTTAAATETAAAAVGAASQWSPVMATYIDTVFRTNAVDDLNATGTNATGTSIQRIDDNDTNGKADWTTGAGAAQTWGALNAGQAVLP